MARGKKPKTEATDLNVGDYRYDTTRKNNPPAKIAAEGRIPAVPKIQYRYSPRLDPVLRFDPTGQADRLPELLETARQRPLTDEEARLVAEALRHQQPWLEWAGKREASGFAVDPVALHIHERVSAQAILKVAARQDVTRDLFADPQQEYRQAVQFYQHDIDWTNRMILGDSLQVMASLAHREDLAGKVQMIYIDPPYGIKFGSNFQPEVGKRDVKDKESDLIREPEMVKAYRDTWTLGVHSYLAYLRDRLIVARELLADSGSIFVQISDENLHRVRMVMDEVFATGNFIAQITIKKTTGSTADFIPGTCDYLLWYSKNKDQTKFYPLFEEKSPGDEGATGYSKVELPSGERRLLSAIEKADLNNLPNMAVVFASDNITSQSVGRDKGDGASSWFKVFIDSFEFTPGLKARWKTNQEGMRRLLHAERLIGGDRSTLSYKRKLIDFPVTPLLNIWSDTVGQNQLGGEKIYVVQTALKIIERCLLMTTDPGDLVLDPTCGSGTTAQVAEAWGRRWITIDTSRVALAIARQRLMTAKFDYYELKPPSPSGRGAGGEGVSPSAGFIYKTVPHITLKSIAQNTNLDPIFARHEPILEARLADLNAALAQVGNEVRRKLASKLLTKQKTEGKRAVTDADSRRWQLPPSPPAPLPEGEGSVKPSLPAPLPEGEGSVKPSLPAPLPEGEGSVKPSLPAPLPEGEGSVKPSPPAPLPEGEGSVKPSPPAPHPKGNGSGFQHWTVPFDTDPDYPAALAEAVTAYRAAWRAKMDEVNACIAANAEQEELVDQPQIRRGVVRVSGPFTMEAVQPPEISLGAGGSPLPPTPSHGGEGVKTPSPLVGEGWGGGCELEELDTGFAPPDDGATEVKNAEAYLHQMLRLLRMDGVRFPNNRQMTFTRLEPITGKSDALHAEGRWMPAGEEDADPDGPATICVAFGPQYGPVTARQVEMLIRMASRRGYDDLVIAGFNFDGPAQAVIEEDANPNVRIHMAHIRPDVNPGMTGLLKEQPGSQLFTVFGQPRTRLDGPDRQGEYTVTMEGVDIYNPVDNTVTPTQADKVAAWFLDSDYDGRTFCITQAFFPDKSAWDKLARALGNVIDAERFAALSGTESLPFPPGETGPWRSR